MQADHTPTEPTDDRAVSPAGQLPLPTGTLPTGTLPLDAVSVDTVPVDAAHVRVVLDRHTRELGLAHVAAIKRALAASAARRAAASDRHGPASGRAA